MQKCKRAYSPRTSIYIRDKIFDTATFNQDIFQMKLQYRREKSYLTLTRQIGSEI